MNTKCHPGRTDKTVYLNDLKMTGLLLDNSSWSVNYATSIFQSSHWAKTDQCQINFYQYFNSRIHPVWLGYVKESFTVINWKC